ncbi:MAG: hypothetical protein IIB77_07235 [Proteobacteria bacterium]|nr:hypothetical protein [Pseudomonadota bacterium]
MDSILALLVRVVRGGGVAPPGPFRAIPPFVGRLNLEAAQRFVSGVHVVTDDEIRGAMRLLIERTKYLVEPAGAAALAQDDRNKTSITRQPMCLRARIMRPSLALSRIQFNISRISCALLPR